MAATLQQLNVRINKHVPHRIHHIRSMLNRMFETKFSSDQIRICLENWELILPIYKDRIGGKSFEEIENEIKAYCSELYQNYAPSLLNCFIPLVHQCINPGCSKNDLGNPIPHHDVIIFCCSERLKKGTMFTKKCSKCSYKYFYNYYIRPGGQKMLTIHPDDEIFVIFSYYGYEKRLLMQIDSDILFKHTGFSNFTNAFNHLNFKFDKEETNIMNRFHLQKTWFLWRLGHFCANENFRMPVPDQQDFHTTLLDLLPFIQELFTKKWGKRDYHAFCRGSCSATIVLDGHQKATRRVCSIKNISIPSIDGTIREVKVGCSAKPAYKSKKCQGHLSTDENDEGSHSNNNLVRTHRHRRARARRQQFRFNPRCKTLKSLQYKRILHHTSGIIAAVYNCGFICSLYELFGCESITQIYNFLLYMYKHIENYTDIIIYDDACHLKLFINNPNNFVKDTRAKLKIDSLKIFCDKLHYRNHIDPWCRQNTNPYSDPIANTTNTEICEQIFSWLAQYKNIVRGFNESTFLIYICLICDLFNSHKYES
ncbi:unnamed protein product [Rotaria magnacalcarata]|uniref:CxC5 like cysteine cluster associated with KDZ domain-containing protein n=1 Tax=Rotaria magnacalcarata TaxID=392030 RepID=A0A816E3A1_9BILA|nr:unnamed protein product [Rotaria magnacalcarata]CAF1644692.1 unnamed protein product [Rotaria magnacalcarata]CAF3841213.1 unnamed protein product [Rotaria magnacalcarata]CAF3859361.1 unnamed protein product [Rotaria magnacalcarata]